LLIAAVCDDNPVIFLEHRWLHNISGEVPEGSYTTEIGKARVVTEGGDLTIVASSYMTLEALRAAHVLREGGIDAELIDVRTLKPLDRLTIVNSVAKTGRLLAVDSGWYTCGFAGEVIATAVESAFNSLKAPPRRLSLPDCPAPTSPVLSKAYYPRAIHIIETACKMVGWPPGACGYREPENVPLDVPDLSFSGPF
jgi:pyruvate dehydrogenase E1 component beta subunit